MGIVKPNDHVVAVQRVHADYCVKIVSVDAVGGAVKPMPFLGALFGLLISPPFIRLSGWLAGWLWNAGPCS